MRQQRTISVGWTMGQVATLLVVGTQTLLGQVPSRIPSDTEAQIFDLIKRRHDPCSLVSAQEAEAVLGTLLVPPYRSHEGSPLAEGGGKSCTYLTKGHHALVLTPTWEYGGMTVEAIRSVGGILNTVVPGLNEVGADTPDGDWEEAGSDRTTGQLYFLKGERLLELGYLLSSTDADGAVRLARIAMGRL